MYVAFVIQGGTLQLLYTKKSTIKHEKQKQNIFQNFARYEQNALSTDNSV